MSRAIRIIYGVCAVLSQFPSTAQGQEKSLPRLGVISFPTSAGPAAQAAFEQGVLWLHSFEYEHAANSFRTAQKLEPDFALAYWGEAMTHNHPVWNERAADSARIILNRLASTPEARTRKAATPREKAWLNSAEVLWAEGPKALRDTLYADAVAKLAMEFPDDEADAFHALAILGLSQGVRNIPSYMRAGKIALDVLARSPNHPGAAHYAIHAFDDPDHAILALNAARAYSRIAPDAGHAQHMTTHIFLALGMWDDVARQNVIAMQAARGNSDSLDWQPGHYTWWLNYARLQQGKWQDARAWLLRQEKLIPDDAPQWRWNFLQAMIGEFQVGVGLYDQSPDRLVTPAQRTPTGILVRGLAFAQPMSTFVPRLSRIADELTAYRTAHPDNTEAPLLEPQLRALVLLADGHPDSAIAVLQVAVDLETSLPIDFGPPAIIRPAHEAMAELLLAAGRYPESKAAYDKALARTPGRSRTLAGMVVAAKAAGDPAASSRAMTQLERNFHDSDPGAIETLFAALPKPDKDID